MGRPLPKRFQGHQPDLVRARVTLGFYSTNDGREEVTPATN